jgi:hypothetical protein
MCYYPCLLIDRQLTFPSVFSLSLSLSLHLRLESTPPSLFFHAWVTVVCTLFPVSPPRWCSVCVCVYIYIYMCVCVCVCVPFVPCVTHCVVLPFFSTCFLYHYHSDYFSSGPVVALVSILFCRVMLVGGVFFVYTCVSEKFLFSLVDDAN